MTRAADTVALSWLLSETGVRILFGGAGAGILVVNLSM